MSFNTVCILGLGYIGLPTATMFASNGLKVIGVDINSHIVETLTNGGLHIQEPGLKEAIDLIVSRKSLTFAEKPAAADAFIIAVPTPFYEDKRADMRAVVSAAEMILPVLREGNLVILESTSPPCTTMYIVQPILEKTGLIAGKDFFLAYSPERVLPGQIMKEMINNDRVVGGINSRSAELAKDLYASFVKGNIFLTDATTAEMVKLMENTYRDVNIAIANEFSRLAERFGVNVWEAIRIANHHPRVKILNPGIGVGGHCISVDPWFFVEAAPDITPLIHTTRVVNDGQPEFVLRIIQKTAGDLKGKKIGYLGLSFKANVDDLRESPAIELANLLVGCGAEVAAYEPHKCAGIYQGLQNVANLQKAVQDASIIVIAVGHQQFRDLRPVDLRKITSASLIFDPTNFLGNDEWKSYGFAIINLISK